MRWTYYDRGLSGQDVATLRRMIVEPTTATYGDSLLSDYIERYPVMDEDGYEPEDDDWTPTYDLAAAASILWGEKAMQHVGEYKFSADGSTFDRDQVFKQCQAAARYWASQAVPSSLEVKIDHEFERDYQSTYWRDSKTGDSSYVVNRAEDDDVV